MRTIDIMNRRGDYPPAPTQEFRMQGFRHQNEIAPANTQLQAIQRKGEPEGRACMFVVGPRSARRKAVVAALKSAADMNVWNFDLFQTVTFAPSVAICNRPQIVVFVQPQAWQLIEAAVFVNKNSQLAVIVIGAKGTRVNSGSVTASCFRGYLSIDQLDLLPTLIRDISLDFEIAAEAAKMDSLKRDAALRESQRLMTIGELTAEISHEINNPLESVGNLLYLMRIDPQLPAASATYIRDAERELSRVARITKQTLDFHRESLEPARIQLKGLMNEVLDLYARRIRVKQLQVVREFSGDDTLVAFPGEIRQVFSNLVTNAIEASFARGQLRVRIHAGAERGGNLERKGLHVCVADNGSGIPEEVQKRIGQLFFTTKGQSGTGLGLYVTKGIVARYEGRLRLRSTTEGIRHGTTFQIFLPTETLGGRNETLPSVNTQSGKSSPAIPKRGTVTQISTHRDHRENQSDGLIRGPHSRHSGSLRTLDANLDISNYLQQRKG